MGIKASLGLATAYALMAGSVALGAEDQYVGTTRWVNGSFPVSVCDAIIDGGEMPKCHPVKAGTPLKIIRAVRKNTGYVEMDVGYAVEEPSGARGYVHSTDPILMSDEAQKKKSDAAANDCKKRGGVSIGMTAAQVYASCWGKPRSVNETITARGKHAQWVYGSGYLYLDDGIVTSMQVSR